jgi:internalin A
MDDRELLQVIEKAVQDGVTELDLSDKQLTELPPEIGQLRDLRYLDLSVNELTALPPEFSQLQSLACLNLERNRLAAWPRELTQLRGLTELDLSYNRLTRLPPEIGQLRNLALLKLSDNELTALPPEIGELSSLNRLNLNYNQFRSLPPEIGKLFNLTELNVTDGQLTALPPELFYLRKLQNLYLAGNALTALRPEIARMRNLTGLFLGRNQLASLPPEITQLRKLTRLDLRSNPPLPLPPEIVVDWHDVQTILAFCQENLWAAARPLSEAKVLLVGQGKVGKTSLVNRLMENAFHPDESKTQGIDIRRWAVTLESSTEVRLNVWDFGGQEILHATHQFFLTRRSLYLLVLDARLDEGENRVDYWLRIIQSFGGDSPVIVVGNQVDEHPLDINRSRLRARYPNVKAIVETSCKTGEGIDALHAVIAREVGRLPHIYDPLALSWFAVKEQLEEMEEDYIPYQRYQEMCRAEGIEDETHQRTLVGFLHDLGVVLNYQEDPRLRLTHILNPEWVTRGVYRILDTNELMTDRKGVLDREMLDRILDCPEYPRERHSYILDMMRRFELCFDLDGHRGERVLIPDLLPRDEPFTGDWTDVLAFEYHYNVLPGSVISRFMVRMNQRIHKGTYWRSGVVLAYGNNRALVRGDEAENKIHICIDGPPRTRQTLLTMIRDDLYHIHRSIAGIQAREMLPLPGHPEIDPVAYAHLLNLERIGQERFVPVGMDETVEVKPLLDLVEPEELRRVRRERQRAQAHPRPGSGVSQLQLEGGKSQSRWSPWLSGAFYLAAALGLIAVIALLGSRVEWLVLLLAVAGGALLLAIIGALQLRQDAKIGDQTFLQLMLEALGRMASLKGLRD